MRAARENRHQPFLRSAFAFGECGAHCVLSVNASDFKTLAQVSYACLHRCVLNVCSLTPRPSATDRLKADHVYTKRNFPPSR